MEDEDSLLADIPLSPILDNSRCGRRINKPSKYQNKSATISLDKRVKNDDTNKAKTYCTNQEFQTASGKKISPKKLSSHFASTLFEDLLETGGTRVRENKFNFLSKSRTGDVNPLAEKKLYDNFKGFENKEHIIAKEKCKNMRQIMKSLTHISSDEDIIENEERMIKKNGKEVKSLLEAKPGLKRIEGASNIFKDKIPVEDNDYVIRSNSKMDKGTNDPTEVNQVSIGFSTASGKKIVVPKTTIQKASRIFEEIDQIKENCPNSIGFSTASGKKIVIPENAMKKVNNLFEGIEKFESNTSDSNTANKDMPQFSTASGKQIQISFQNTFKASNIFKDISSISTTITPNVQTVKSEVEEVTSKPIVNVSKTDTPVKTPTQSLKRKRLGISNTKNAQLSTESLKRARTLFSDMNFNDLKLPASFSNAMSPNPVKASRVLFTPVKKSIESPHQDPVERNCPYLIQKPTVGNIVSWHEELKKQRIALEKKLSLITDREKALANQIVNMGKSLENKCESTKKVKKLMLKELENVENLSYEPVEVHKVIYQINPQNATLIQLNGNWNDVATIETDNGTVVVPNQQNLIGLSEIEAAFLSRLDVNKNFVPDGWVKNHYKWIVWKLASYERFFPSMMRGTFTVDNIMKQLKYRYDREIYRNERPALRKIYETDDAPQKTMVLSISNIFKNQDKIELELTDGWYSIRTIIDEPLCVQVNKKRIKIGSKIAISNADIVNCDGCHPLEPEAQKVRLRIHFNGTKRAKWFAKLGYQRIVRPFLIRLDDCFPAGGLIGRVNVYIVRVFPLVYMEKTKDTTVWRNGNAENKRLCDIESRENMENFHFNSSIAVLRMLVIDVLGSSDRCYKFSCWNANDFHLEQFKESRLIALYNVMLRMNNELGSGKKTCLEYIKDDCERYEKFRRKYTAIDTFQNMSKNTIFDLFDTIGLVVEMQINKESQAIWLTNLNGNLLLVNVNEGPNTCLLLSRIQEGEVVAVSNLILKEDNGYCVAVANQSSVFTTHPQQKFLQDQLDNFERTDKKVLKSLWEGCKHEIAIIRNGSQFPSTQQECSNVTTTERAMAMIDIEEVLSKSN